MCIVMITSVVKYTQHDVSDIYMLTDTDNIDAHACNCFSNSCTLDLFNVIKFCAIVVCLESKFARDRARFFGALVLLFFIIDYNFSVFFFFFFQAEDGIRDLTVTGVQTCALPISSPTRERTVHRIQWALLSAISHSLSLFRRSSFQIQYIIIFPLGCIYITFEKKHEDRKSVV